MLCWNIDLDSMVSAIAYAYDISHLKHGSSKAVALLQVEAAAIDLRPENKLALTKAGMARGHKDLLSQLNALLLQGSKYSSSLNTELQLSRSCPYHQIKLEL